MQEISPRVYLIARPALDWEEIGRFLDSVGGRQWQRRALAGSPPVGEALIEFMGRLCYRSWAPGLNPNVTRIREDSSSYIANILESGHGSVLEHASYTFVFHHVSRVFTHELVRHRAGVAISQESLRYVRLTSIPFEHPETIRSNPELLDAATQLLAQMESFQELVAGTTDVASHDVDFHTKKHVTSAMRRYAPDGVATTIGWTANVRALRHIIAMRTDPAAEEEIRRVFDQVAEIMRKELPALFQDFVRTDDGWWRPHYPKV